MNEAQVQAKIEQLSAGAFQRLAECFAEITWPERYLYQVPQGRNADNATTVGWPDAWAPSDTGEIHAVEATRDLDWEKHLVADLRKATALPAGNRLASFVFVSRKDPRPAASKLADYIASFGELGLAANAIDLIFMDTLRLALAGPRFARVRAQLLGLPATNLPLLAIEEARALYGDGSVRAFRPTWEEYATGRVHRNSAHDAVAEHLHAEGWALMQGNGASGKTALCVNIAHDHVRRLLPVWYLDLTGLSTAEINEADERMHLLGGPGVLFIVDNVHLADVHAGYIYDHWRQRDDGSLLLLAGRRVSSAAFDGFGSPLAELEESAIRVDADVTDLRGIYRRLAQRDEPTPRHPPSLVCAKWLTIFGGDLIAFSSAIASRGPAAVAQDWQLGGADAIDYVKARYFQILDDDGRRALTRVAALSALEVPAPATVADPLPLQVLVGSGLLLESGTPSTLRTIHPGVALLILATAGESAVPFGVLDEIAGIDPLIGAQAAQRLTEQVRHRALPLWRTVLNQDATTFVSAGLDGFAWTARTIVENDIFSATELDEMLCGSRTVWERAVRTSTARALGTSLGMAASLLPRTAALIRSLLADGVEPALWLVELLETGDDWPGLALFAAQSRAVWPSLADALDERLAETISLRLTDTVMERGFGRPTRRALRRLTDDWPQTGAKLAAALAARDDDDWCRALTRSDVKELSRNASAIRALEGAADRFEAAIRSDRFVEAFLAQYLDVAPTRLPFALTSLLKTSRPAHASVGEVLAETGRGEAWARDVCGSSLAAFVGARGSIQVPSFMREIEAWLDSLTDDALTARLLRSAPRVVAAVVQSPGALGPRCANLLGEDSVAAGYAPQVAGAMASDAQAFVSLHIVSGPTVQHLDAKRWATSRVTRSIGQAPRAFSPLVCSLGRHGRSDLARGLAVALSEAVWSGSLDPSALPLAALSHLARLTDGWPEGTVTSSVHDALVSKDWLLPRLAHEPIHEVASFLFSLWHYAPGDVAEIPHDMVIRRVREASAAELGRWQLDGLLQLIGAVALIGAPVQTTLKDVCTPEALASAVERLMPVGHPVTPIQAQRWLGIRAVLSANPSWEIPLVGAGDVIARLDTQDYSTLRHVETGRTITDWLVAMQHG